MISNSRVNNQIILSSTSSQNLTNHQIMEICLLKNKQWKFGIKSQINWFKKNIKKNDVHNLLYFNYKLIGYTALRKRSYEIDNLKKKNIYLLFDTLILDKKFRGKKIFSSLLMNFNNSIIRQMGFISFLVCNSKSVKFYKKNNWKILNKKKFEIADHPFSKIGMVFNKYNKIKKILFYFNK